MSSETESRAETLLCRLEASEFRTVICVDERGAQRLREGWSEMCRQIEQKGRVAILVDGSRGRGFYEVLSQWVDEAEEEGRAEARRLFDYLTMALDMGCEEVKASQREDLIVDATVRLMEQLAEEKGALVAVLKPEELSALERRALKAGVHHFLDDPLAEIDPELGDESPVGFIWAGPPQDLQGVDAQMEAEAGDRTEEVRRFLQQDRVVQRLMDTTKGDYRRLEAVFGALPETVTHLWTRRVEELSPRQREVASVLAVAGVALEIGFLSRVVDGPVIAVVREMCDRGIAARSMDGGIVKVGLASSEIREGVEAGLSEEERQGLHALLATAAMERGGEDGAFVARHALAAGDGATGMRFGLPAARGLLRRGQWQQADRLIATLCEVEEAKEEDRREILKLALRLEVARSRWQEALLLSEELLRLATEESEVARLRRRRGFYQARVGDLDAAEETFRCLLETSGKRGDELEACRGMMGLAEVHYQRGDHEQALSWASKAREELAEREELSAKQEELLIDCATLLGRAALYRGELGEAWEHFEEAAGRARRIGLGEEESRAEVNLGVVAVQRRRYEEARRRLERALEKAQMAAGSLRLNCWLNLGIVHQRRGEFSLALDHYGRSLKEANRRADEVAAQVALHNLATLYQDMGAFGAARRLVEEVEKRQSTDNEGQARRFAQRWAAMTRAQILLKSGAERRALEALEDAERRLTTKQRLYGQEMRLRRAMAHLSLDEMDEAAQILEESVGQEVANPQFSVLHQFYSAAMARRSAETVGESKWRSIIDELESLGMFQDATQARLELVAELEEQGAGASKRAGWLVERGVEELRRRLETVPERFRKDYLAIPVHRELIEKYRVISDEDLPQELDAGDGIVGADHAESQEEKEDKKGTKSHADDAAYRRWRAGYGNIVGEDRKMLHIFQIVDRVAPSETTVLLAGESGTGKELIAEAIHDKSERSEGPFIRVNCAAFVEELLLSELFGHEKGAFTGAVEARAGRFERADGGTIFLDEIGDISAKTQVALLRVLQQGTFERVGGTERHEVDVRVVAATNRDLDKMVREGTFRLDLYYRLKGFLIEMPPLRQRREDIPRLLQYFAARFADGSMVPQFSEEAVQFLAQYRWPGNVRELENFVRSVLLFTDDDSIGMDEIGQFREFFSEEEMDLTLPPVDWTLNVEEQHPELEPQPQPIMASGAEEALVEAVIADEQCLSRLKKRLERKCIEAALRQTGGNITQAARILQMKRPRLSQIVNGDEELNALKEELVG